LTALFEAPTDSWFGIATQPSAPVTYIVQRWQVLIARLISQVLAQLQFPLLPTMG